MCRTVLQDRDKGRWQAGLSRPYLPVSDCLGLCSGGRRVPYPGIRVAGFHAASPTGTDQGRALIGSWPSIPLMLWLLRAHILQTLVIAPGGSAWSSALWTPDSHLSVGAETGTTQRKPSSRRTRPACAGFQRPGWGFLALCSCVLHTCIPVCLCMPVWSLCVLHACIGYVVWVCLSLCPSVCLSLPAICVGPFNLSVCLCLCLVWSVCVSVECSDFLCSHCLSPGSGSRGGQFQVRDMYRGSCAMVWDLGTWRLSRVGLGLSSGTCPCQTQNKTLTLSFCPGPWATTSQARWSSVS